MRDIYTIFDLEGKTAIVTGGSRGLGFGIAECLAKAGANVVVANRNASEGDRAKRELEQYGTKVLAVTTDVSDSISVGNMVSRTLDEFGELDILINNAGILKHVSLQSMAEEDWDQLIDINLKGVFLCGKAACEHMMKKGGGKIVNVASVRSMLTSHERGAYCASKGGIAMLTKAMALEWAPYNIIVNAVAPGEFTSGGSLDGIPLGRIGSSPDLYGIILLLASGASSYLTGQTIYVDGGWSTWKL